MVRVAICDDEKQYGQKVYELTAAFFEKEDIRGNVQIFDNSMALYYEVEDGKHFDIFLLDIEMPKANGIALTEMIQKHLPEAVIIFVTSHLKYVYDVFKVRAFRFVTKDRLEEMISPALRDAVGHVQKQDGKSYVVENQRGIEKVLLKDIVYIWHEGKYSLLQTERGPVLKVRKTLKQVYEELDAKEFVWVDRSYICNMGKIAKTEDEDVVLTDGTRLSLQRGRINEFKARLRDYWFEERMG